jgi:exodeoxyribonuclease V beta subunit
VSPNPNLGEPQAFDVCGPLPTGVTVLEASAGTGKTFTIAALAARYVAAGIPLEHLLLVTFTRMATGELRERVRDRLVTAEDGLARALSLTGPNADDDVAGLLAQGDGHEIEQRRRRLARALADFDAATIVTTHGFCQHVLAGLGVAGDVERDAVFVEDLRDLVEEVVDDLYIRRFAVVGDKVRFDRAEALMIGRAAVDNPFAPIEPRRAGNESAPGLRRRLAKTVRDEVERRKRRLGLLTFDDLLSRLRAIVADETNGAAVCQRLRHRYRVALVDEFQDTDPVQWEILRRAFGEGVPQATLVLIGDPKQAIYAFRGADVYAYLDAARAAGTRATLPINWRSDQGLIDAYDVVLRGVKLGHKGIAYRTVRAAEANQTSRLLGAPAPEPLRVRVLYRGDRLVDLTAKGFANLNQSRGVVARDVAADLVALLSSGAEIETRHQDGSAAGREPVRPGHVAVLVPTHQHAARVRDALDGAGVPAVINGAGSVFGAPVAREWLRLLEALERPTSPPRARSAALTSFLGWSAEEVAFADERAWEDVHVRLHRWAGVLRRRGVASLLEIVTLTEGLPGRVLARQDGERQLTDLRHVGQLLHAAATTEQMGVTALIAWLRQRIAEAAADTHNEERSRRLESDAEAVQVLTVHRAKGLEFPVVYYPYLWEPGFVPERCPVVFHDPAAGDRRTIDVGLEGEAFEDHRSRYVVEQRGEDLRLAYVALTRAQHQAVVWWAGSWDSRNSPLCRLLFAPGPDGNVAAFRDKVPDDNEVAARFAALAAEAPGCIAVERVAGGRAEAWTAATPEPIPLEAGRFDRRLDQEWRRTSYTAITAQGHEPRVASEPEETVVVDEPDTAVGPTSVVAATGEALPAPAVAAADDPADLRAVPLLLAEMPGGVDVGTFVHRVLERTDFTAADLDTELGAGVERERARRHVEIGDPSVVTAGLRAAVETPLGPLVGDRRLADFGPGDRLDELAFELPLVGGETPGATLAVGELAALLDQHLPRGDVLSGYGPLLRALRADLRGFLTGSLDLVLRVRDSRGGGIQRFAVVDYKTNWLGAVAGSEPLTAWHYRPAALAEAMHRAHYPLQALLYTVALHRYLRWRLPGYDPEANLAGVLYLFLRGMAGPEAPRVGDQPCGVFAWRPPATLVVALSDLLEQGAAA